MLFKKFILLVVLILFVGFLAGARFTIFDFGQEKEDLGGQELAAAGSVEKFNFLSQQRSSSCSLQPSNVEGWNDNEKIQGACCSAIDLHRYQEQVKGLGKYSHIPQIPQDPYDISVSLAKELFGYQRNIELTDAQQKIYDDAMEKAHEGGPCCCKCWRWVAFEGQAKYLITKHNFTAEQVAEVWDLEDGCGGEGHEHG